MQQSNNRYIGVYDVGPHDVPGVRTCTLVRQLGPVPYWQAAEYRRGIQGTLQDDQTTHVSRQLPATLDILVCTSTYGQAD